MTPFVIAVALLALLHLPGLRRLAGGTRPSDKAAVALGLALLVPGVLHLVEPESFVAMVPAWLGQPARLVFVSGVAELLIAAGLCLPLTRRWAGWGAAALFVAVWPADVNVALQQSGALPFVRVALQPVYIVWGVWVALGHIPGERVRRLGFASLYDRVTLKHGAYLAGRKTQLIGELRGTVLEAGPGTGVNLPFFDSSVKWIGVEPNPHMRQRLSARARELGIEPEFRSFGPHGLEVADASVDAVVTTLVQCSVPDPEAFVREVRRVLVPGGRFVFIEHVAAPRGTPLRLLQNLVQPVTSFMADGCCPNRELADVIRAGGFSSVEVEAFDVPPEVLPKVASPHIAGVATK